MKGRDQLTIVIIGHVDHGKSTLIGRLLADTKFLPNEKLKQVKSYCERNAKVFEYAFLLDALKEEQSQGITIDAARCFFKTNKRDYLIIDAPGHFEFVKNMVTGASRASAAIIVIDAKEGIKENTKRHGYLLSLLGQEYICVAVNKMDLVKYDKITFDKIVSEYNSFLRSVGINNTEFIPICARNGENIVNVSENMKWYTGKTLLQTIENLEIEENKDKKSFRFYVQDVYKFTKKGDEARILAGTISYGWIQTGDEVVFYPTMKKSLITSIENYPHTVSKAKAGESIGLVIKDPFYISSGELIVKAKENNPPAVSRKFLANVFWMEVAPLIVGKPYQAKIGQQKVLLKVTNIEKVIDSIDPTNVMKKDKLERYDIGVCEIESFKPLAFDTIQNFKATARFVLIDQYKIAACGIIVNKIDDSSLSIREEVTNREKFWEKGFIQKEHRENKYKHKGKFILITGLNSEKIKIVAKELEKKLFQMDKNTYFLSINSLTIGLDKDLTMDDDFGRYEEIRRIGELAHIMADAGLIFITSITNIENYELELLQIINSPYELFTVAIVLNNQLKANLCLFEEESVEEIVRKILEALAKENIIIEYFI